MRVLRPLLVAALVLDLRELGVCKASSSDGSEQ